MAEDGPTWGYKGDKAKLFESDEARRAAKWSDSPKSTEPVADDDGEQQDDA